MHCTRNRESFIVFVMLLALVWSLTCLQETRVKKYYKARKCRRSDAAALGRTTVGTLKDCAQYARGKNALAFNYSPPEARGPRKKRPTTNCQVLGCPELNNFTSLVNDTYFDYYTSFGNATILENATCIKSVGVFRLIYEKYNYTAALEHCQTIFADLAHIVSETRTNALATVLATMSDWYKAAYVGLDDSVIEGRYETALGDPMDCYKYRAWSPGQPRARIKSDDCVVLENTRTWKIVNCKRALPSLCEVYPTPPDGYRHMYLDVECDDIDDSGERDSCRDYKKRQQEAEAARPKRRRNRCLDPD